MVCPYTGALCIIADDSDSLNPINVFMNFLYIEGVQQLHTVRFLCTKPRLSTYTGIDRRQQKQDKTSFTLCLV